MNYMNRKYPDQFVGVAVHGGDPMEDFEWIGTPDDPDTPEDEGTAFAAMIGGYPNSIVNRDLSTINLLIDAAEIERPFVSSVTLSLIHI